MSGAIFISDDLVPSSSAQLQLMMSQILGPDAKLNISEFCLKKNSSAGSRQMLSRQLRPSRSVAIVLSPTQPVINLEEAMYILAALFKVVQDQFKNIG